MGDSPEGQIHGASGGGVAGSNIERENLGTLVATSTEDQFNTIRSAIFPIGCFKMEDLRFDFDSSLILPEAAAELPLLKSLLDKHGETDSDGKITRVPPISIFGHADPVGTDDYNKALSGRRAASMYGMLTRRAEVWEDLYSNGKKFTQPALGDKWGIRPIQIMLNTVLPPSLMPLNDDGPDSDDSPLIPLKVDGQMGPRTKKAVEQFQGGPDGKAAGLKVDGDPGVETRKALFLAYMNKLCVDKDGKPYQLDPVQSFLGQNADSAGKADFQGCSEFNPVLLFSKADLRDFQAAADKTDRDLANAPNRRVMVLVFRLGAKVTADLWPCPRAKDNTGGCRKRFWSDGDQRRANGDEQREFEKTHDTFACRFYQRLITGSPCEAPIKLMPLKIRLIDDRDQVYAGMSYRLEIGDRPYNGVTTADGFVEQSIPSTSTSGKLILLRQSTDDAQAAPTEFWTLPLQIARTMPDANTPAGAAARLTNLGLHSGDGSDSDLAKRAIQRFQVRQQVKDAAGKQEISGTLTDPTAVEMKKQYGS